MLKQALFNIAKAPFMGKFIGLAFQYFSLAIPVKKVYNGKDVIAFYHPKPSYQNHIIISPKKAITNLQQMSDTNFNEYFVKTWEAVRKIYSSHPEYQDSFVLVANGGKRQEVGQVHFHMFTNHDVLNTEWEIHTKVSAVAESQLSKEYFKKIMQSVALLDAEYDIAQKGYSLVYQYEKQKSNDEALVFHIVAGKKGEIIK